MEKKIGHRAVIEVEGFHDARRWIDRLMGEGVIKCGQCDAPATNVFWQDRAEWYCRCELHREYGQQWTGSTRWNPSVFSLNVLKDLALAWWQSAPKYLRKKVSIRAYDATDYYALMTEDWNARTQHYFVGSAKEYGRRVYATVTPLTNGEYVYELHNDYMNQHGGHMHAYGIKGAWESEALALDAAKADARKRGWLEKEPLP